MSSRYIATLLLGILLPLPAPALPPLQLYVELTPAGGVLRPEPGRYSGPVVISRPITIDGQGRVTLDGGGEGTVLTVEANGSVIRGLHLTGSGDSYDQVDAGLLLKADNTLIEDNTLDEVLFGILLNNANGNTIRGNRITSKDYAPGMQGNGLRLWYSHENLIEDNDIEKVRDVFITNSSQNRLIGNRIRYCPVGMELIFSPDNEIIGNTIVDDDAGILVFYSDGLEIRENHISHLRSYSGSALAFKESSGVVVSDNEILHCAVGVTANAPLHPENIITLRNNHFAYNDTALYFYGEKGGHIVQGNRFVQNLTDIRVSAPSTALNNDWKGNHWDRYQGFDRDGDGVGDFPFELYLYSDRLWMDRPLTQFFRGSPMAQVIDFMERLAPFSPPQLLLRDPAPAVQ